MADVRGVTNAGVPQPNQPGEESTARVTTVPAQAPEAERTTGPAGPLGQPTGMPVPGVPPDARTLPDVLAGRDPTQLRAAELLRDSGGVSATEKLLGLDLQPSVVGAFSAPPGNSEALRHMTPVMRRTAMRNLLLKQRERMHRLESRLQHEEDEDRNENEGEGDYYFPDDRGKVPPQLARARSELSRASLMLNLLEELLVMQDYAISQMGTFSKG